MKKLFILLLLSGCYTAKKADKQVIKAQLYHPEVVAKKSAMWYPCKPSVTTSDSAAYKEWQQQLEELNAFYASIMPDSVYVYEAVKDTVLVEKIKQVKNTIVKLQRLPAIHDTIVKIDSAGNYLKQQEINTCTVNFQELDKKHDDLKDLLIWLIIALAVSTIINILQAKFRK